MSREKLQRERDENLYRPCGKDAHSFAALDSLRLSPISLELFDSSCASHPSLIDEHCSLLKSHSTFMMVLLPREPNFLCGSSIGRDRAAIDR